MYLQICIYAYMDAFPNCDINSYASDVFDDDVGVDDVFTMRVV